MIRPALHLAFLLKNRSMILSLIKSGHDVNEKDIAGDSPIIFAAQYGWVEEIEQLLGAGADINIEDSYGNTAIMLAVAGKHPEATGYMVMQSSLEQLHLFKEQLMKCHKNDSVKGLATISQEMLQDAYTVIDKSIFERKLHNDLIKKTLSTHSRKI